MKNARFEELRWKDFDGMDREKTIFFLPMGSLEEHGPHLPVGTDLSIALEIAKEVAKLVKEEGLRPVLLPPIPFAPCSFTYDFPGTISIDAKVIKRMIYDVSRSLSLHNFRYLVICTYHMDPFFIGAIHRSIRKVERKFKMRVAEPGSSYFYGRKSKDVHAGREETSIMLYICSHLVDPSYKSLSDFLFQDLSIKDFRKTLRELGALEGYVGFPSDASVEHGKKLFEEIVDHFVDATLKLLRGKYVLQTPKWLRFLPLSLQRR